MECRAELGAVEGEGAWCIGVKLDGDGFAWLERGGDVVDGDGKAVCRVEGTLRVGDVPAHFVALLEGNVLGVEVRSDRGHVDIDRAVVISLDPFHAFFGGHGLEVLDMRVPAHARVGLPGVELVGFDDLRIVGLTDAHSHVVDHGHLGAALADIHELKVLREQRSGGDEAIDRPFVE